MGHVALCFVCSWKVDEVIVVSQACKHLIAKLGDDSNKQLICINVYKTS